MFKRIVSFLLALVLLTGMIPVPARATDTAPRLDTGEMSVEGTNDFGRLLSQDVAEHQASIEAVEEDYTDGFNVTNLEITGNTAKVTYDSLETATIIVAIYTENGRTLLCSGHGTAEPDQTQATVTIAGTMPEYFYASAYLVDTYDMSPLCPAYDTPLYTKEMQDLLASTVDDYDKDLVLNLDDDKDTNFAVYAETTKIIESDDDVNTILSTNDETFTYVIGNADEQVTSLQTGDVVVCLYGESDMLILKVASLTVEEDTVTIHGADLQMEEVFSHVKIEGTGDTSDAQVDESAALDPGLTYQGLTKDPSATPSAFGEEGEFSKEFSFSYELFKKGADENGFSVSGALNFSVATELKFLVSPTRQFIELRMESGLKFEGEFKGAAGLDVPLLPIKIPIVPGVSIGCSPEFIVEFEATLTLEIGISASVGVSYESGKGFQNLSESPKFDKPDIGAEGTLFIGVNLKPNVSVAEGAIAELSLDAKVGGELTAEMTGSKFEEDLDEARAEFSEDELHSCELCVDGNVSVKIEIGCEITFLNWDKLTFERTFGELKFPIGNFYYSITNKKFGWNGCPYKEFRIIFTVKNAINQSLKDIPVSIENGKQLGITDAVGKTAAYLPAGKYTFRADVPNKNVTHTATISEACKIQLTAERTEINLGGALGSLSSENYKDYGSVLASGAEGSVRWYIYKNGTMRVQGEGALSSEQAKKIQLYRNSVTDLIISSGITGLATQTFANFTRLETVKIPDTVTNWGSWVFQNCTALTTVTVPVDYYPGTFQGCDHVEKITYTPGPTGKMPDRTAYSGYYNSIHNQMEFVSTETLQTVVFEEGVTQIGAYALAYVDALTSVTTPSTLESIGTYAFANCDALPTIHLPQGLSTLGSYAFANCVSLDNITIPSSLTAIDACTFSGCTSLSKITLPESITYVGSYAFQNCTSLKKAVISDNVTNWGSYAFIGCTALEEVTVPVDYAPATFQGCNHVQKITYTPGSTGRMPDRTAYSGYDSSIHNQMELASTETLHTLVFKEGITSIGAYALAYVDALTSVTIPSTMESIGTYAFADCDALPTIHLPQGLSTIGNYAFANCVSLDNITIPTTLTAIDTCTFSGCTSLSEITLPDSIAYVGTYAFQNCTSLKKAVISDNVTSWGSYAFIGCTALEEVTVPVDYAPATFQGCNHVQKITYTPGSTGRMPDRTAYSGYDSSIHNQMELASMETLQTVVFEEGVTAIGAYALAYVDALTSVTIPSTMESIGTYAFADCDALPTIHLPQGLSTLGSYAFANCVSLDNITIPTSLATIDTCTFSGCTNLSEITLPESITYVGTYAFQNCINLKKAVISDNVTSWGSYAFIGCTALEEVTVPVDYAPATFQDCNHVQKITYTPGSTGKMPDRTAYSGYDSSIHNQMELASMETLQTVVFEEGVTQIGAYALAYVDALTSVTIPSTMESIGTYAFADCDALPTIHLPQGLFTLGSYAFANCVSLDNITIPSSLATIDTCTFSGCSSLSEITLPDSITYVGTYAFQNCTSLKKAVISDNVTSWGSYAFIGCTALEEVTVPVDYAPATFHGCNHVQKITYTPGPTGKMPGRTNYSGYTNSIHSQMEYASTETLHTVVFEEGVTQIGAYALAYVDALTSVTLPSTLEAIEAYAFQNVTADVYYPAQAETWNTDLMQDYGGSLTWIPLDEIPEETIPEETVPEETVPEEIVLEETIPEETVSEETIPEESVPAELPAVEAVPEETFPEETAPLTEAISETVPMELPEETLIQTEPVVLARMPKTPAAHLLRASSGAAVRALSAGEEILEITAVTEPISADEPLICDVTEPVSADGDQDFSANIPSNNAIFDGEYDSEQYEEYILKTATFKGLTPGAQYLLLAVLDLNASDPIALSNLVHIDQGTAASDGTLRFQYVERQETDYSYVMACGASNKNLKNAKITMDPLFANGTLQVIDPTVTYNGTVLAEGRDYVLSGSVAFLDGGDYTCHIRGIYDYTGLLKCTYSVEISDIVAAGNWGSLTWQFMEDGSLILSGTDETLPDPAASPCPWQDFAPHTTKIVIDDGIQTLSGSLFPDFAKVTSVSIGKDLTALNGDVFGGCTGLTTFLVSPDNTAYRAEDGLLYSADKSTLVRYAVGLPEQNVRIPESVTAIAPWAFAGCSRIVTLTFPGNAPEFVGENAFHGVSAQVNYPARNDTWTEDSLKNGGGTLFLEPQASLATVIGITAETDQILSGTEFTLTAQLSSPNATNTTIFWTIEDGADYVSLKSRGITAVLQAGIVKEAQTVTISARSKAFFDSKEITLQILPLAEGVEILADGAQITGKTVTFDVNEPDRTLALTARVLPEDTLQQVQWTSSNLKVATVSDGLVTFTGALGKVTITAKAAEKIAAQVTFQTVAVPHNLKKEFNAETVGDADLAILGGKSANLRVTDLDTGKFLTSKQITWSLDPVHAAYASVNAAGKLTTKTVWERKRLEIVGTMVGNDRITLTYTVDLHPAVSQIELYADETLCGSTVLSFNLAERDNMTLSAKLYPAGVMDLPVKWTISDKKNTYASYTVDGNEILIHTPTGKAGTVTFKAAAADGSGKNATVKVQFGTFAQSVTITSEETELISGKSLTLNAIIAPEAAAKTGITWSLKNPEDKNYVTLSASGKLTAKTVYGEKAVTVIAASKDGRAEPDEHTVTILPKDAGMLILMMAEDNVTKSTVSVDLNNVTQLELNALNYRDGTEEPVTWKSSGEKVASVKDGIVTIHKKGSVTITATAKDKRKAVVTLKIDRVASDVIVEDAIVASGKTVTLKATVLDAANTKVDWSIVDGSQYAKIASSGKLTAAKDLASQQTVTVRATAKDGSEKYGEATVIIKSLAQGVQIRMGSTILSDTTMGWDMGQTNTLQLTALVFPFYESNESQSAIQAVQWKTSAKAVATVDEHGRVTCLKPGNATITATAADGSGKKASFKLTVVKRVTQLSAQQELTVVGSKSLTLSKLVTITPTDATNKKLQWTLVSGGEFASLSATGALKTKKVTQPQTVEILVEATDGSGIKLPLVITILPKA